MQLLLLCVFFVSGFATLVYQTIWQRMLTLFGGADVQSATIIVAAFMAGLGFGGLAGGHLADRLNRRRRLWTFAACEIAVGLFALVSAFVYYDTLYVGLGSVARSKLTIAGLTFLVTLIPTFVMGMSLPLLACSGARKSETPAAWISQLYGWNTLGAAAGSLFAATVLFRTFDLRINLQIGAALNVSCAVAVWFLARSAHDNDLETPDKPPGSTLTREFTDVPFRAWLLLYAVSGFVSLSLEIIWFRMVGAILKSSAISFAYLLAIYLGGLGVGSLMADSRVLRRVDATRMFFRLQAAVPIWAALSVALLASLLNYTSLAPALRQALASPEPVRSYGLLFITHGLVPLALMVPPTLMMGLSFGLLQKAVQTDASLVGRRVGWLQAANILGATLGAIGTGLILLDTLGSVGTLRILVVCSALFVVLPGRGRNFVSQLGRVTLVVVVIAFIPDRDSLWAALHGGRAGKVVVNENASGAVVLRQDPEETKMFLGGISQSWLPYGGVHTALGALPALMHPQPEHIALIGLASGDTLYAIGSRSSTRTIESLEIVSSELPALQRVAQLGQYPALQFLLADPRVRHHTVDGRLYLRQSPGRFDIVEADPVLPHNASAGNLYSVEYFAVLRDALRPGGLAVSWLPTKRTEDTFASVFPHALNFRGIGIGSLSAIAFDREAVIGRMNSEFTREYFARGRVDVAAALKRHLALGPLPMPGPPGSTGLNRDLFPMDEFRVRYTR